MAYPTTGVLITGPLAVGSSNDSYPTHIAELGKGGYVSAETITIRDSISADRKTSGMACYVWNDGTSANNGLYIWNGSSWISFSSLFAPTIVDATTSVKGIVKVGSNINVSSGEISVSNADSNTYGVVKVGTGLQINGSTGALETVTVDPLKVYNDADTLVGTSGELQFKGLGFTVSNTGNRNIVTFAPSNIYVGSTSYPDITSLKFAAGSNVTLTPTTPSSNTLQIEIGYTGGNGIIPKALGDLNDVALTTPSNLDILQYNSSTSKWINTPYTGITKGDLSVSGLPLSYNNSTGQFSIALATSSANGYLSSTDWSTFNGKQATITGAASTVVSSDLTVLRVLISSNAGKIAVSTVTNTELNYLSGVTSAIQTQLNSKQSTLSFGNITESTSAVLTINNGNGAVVGSGVSIQVKEANDTQDGYLTSSRFLQFVNKLNIAATNVSGTSSTLNINFQTTDTIYGSPGTPMSGNTISVSTTSAILGVTHIVIHNASSAPTISGAVKLSGSGFYKANVLNYIYFTYVGGTKVIYSINQEA